jgi:hypothetical protein
VCSLHATEACSLMVVCACMCFCSTQVGCQSHLSGLLQRATILLIHGRGIQDFSSSCTSCQLLWIAPSIRCSAVLNAALPTWAYVLCSSAYAPMHPCDMPSDRLTHASCPASLLSASPAGRCSPGEQQGARRRAQRPCAQQGGQLTPQGETRAPAAPAVHCTRACQNSSMFRRRRTLARHPHWETCPESSPAPSLTKP